MKENATTYINPTGSKIQFQVYNPGATSIFPVSSTLIVGQTEVVLIDTQFQNNDALELMKLIKATGKKLTSIYISHGEPQFYFGTEVIMREYPDCNVYATRETIRRIRKTNDAKLAYWNPMLRHHAPRKIYMPSHLKNRSFSVDATKVEVTGPHSDCTYCWIPSLKTVVGGLVVFGVNMHLWLADNHSPESRYRWYEILTSIEQLKPEIVVPSHFYPGAPMNLDSVQFSKEYLSAVETELEISRNSAEFTAAMKNRFPDLQNELNLEMSAKVLKNEMKLPT